MTCIHKINKNGIYKKLFQNGELIIFEIFRKHFSNMRSSMIVWIGKRIHIFYLNDIQQKCARMFNNIALLQIDRSVQSETKKTCWDHIQENKIPTHCDRLEIMYD